MHVEKTTVMGIHTESLASLSSAFRCYVYYKSKILIPWIDKNSYQSRKPTEFSTAEDPFCIFMFKYIWTFDHEAVSNCLGM